MFLTMVGITRDGVIVVIINLQCMPRERGELFGRVEREDSLKQDLILFVMQLPKV